MHQGIDSFRVAVPEGFEITDVHAPRLKKWTMWSDEKSGENKSDGDKADGDIVDGDDAEKAGSRTLELEFREGLTGKNAITLSAIRTTFDPTAETWTLPRFEPLDVESPAAVLGLLLDTRLNIGEMTADRLIPVELQTLTTAIPPTVFDPSPGAPTLRGVAAWYAPCAIGSVSATFRSPEAELDVDSEFQLTLSQDGQTLAGFLTLTPRGRRLFEAEILMPESCRLLGLTDTESGNPIPFEIMPGDLTNDRTDGPDSGTAGTAPQRVNVRFPDVLPVDVPHRVKMDIAVRTENWLNDWEALRVSYPRPRIVSPATGTDTGTLAVYAAGERDYDITAEKTERAFPAIDPRSLASKPGGFVCELRYLDPNPVVELLVRKTAPRLRADVVAFCRFETALLRLRYEITFFVEEARTDTLRFSIPKELIATPRIEGLDGLAIKEQFSREHFSREHGDCREFTVRLAVPALGRLRLAVDTQLPLDDGQPAEGTAIVLPMLHAEDVAWQSMLVAVEGDEDLDLRILNTDDGDARDENDGKRNAPPILFSLRHH